jgi:hypothetical protein
MAAANRHWPRTSSHTCALGLSPNSSCMRRACSGPSPSISASASPSFMPSMVHRPRSSCSVETPSLASAATYVAASEALAPATSKASLSGGSLAGGDLGGGLAVGRPREVTSASWPTVSTR